MNKGYIFTKTVCLIFLLFWESTGNGNATCNRTHENYVKNIKISTKLIYYPKEIGILTNFVTGERHSYEISKFKLDKKL